MSRYATNTDLNIFFRGFTTKYYGTFFDDDPTNGSVVASGQSEMDSDLDRESAYIDGKLSALGYRTPLAALSGGTYDQVITEWCACSVIYKRLIRNHADDYQDGFPNDITIFGSRAKDLEYQITDRGLVLNVDVTMEESGIGFAYAGGTSGVATFTNNKEFGGIYTDDSWEGRIIVQIDGTTAGNNIGESTFKWSRDGGVSYEVTAIDTATNWIRLFEGIDVRWYPASGTNNQLDYGDWWYFDVVPKTKKTKVAPNVARFRTFARG
jgi:hypothetical protein